ncbi:MAG TPA: energy transducer TonB [Bacteroidales bacterium]|nr:energy transducer TonB [Bacteroidales bacterium]
MKNLIHLMVLVLLTTWQVFSQCDPRLSMKVPDDPDHFIKSFDAFMPDENDSVLKYTLLLHQGARYKIEVFENDEFKGRASYSLYEGNKLLGTNYEKDKVKPFPSFDFICQKSLVYDMVVRKEGKGKYCASWVIQEMKDSGESYFEFADSGKTDTDQDGIFNVVDIMPEFIADRGVASFLEWIAQNVVYPEEALKEGISGKVFVNFVVDEDGNVVNAKVIRSVHPILDQAAFELIKSSPRWAKPGIQKGIKVKVAFTFPITYVLKPKPKDK